MSLDNKVSVKFWKSSGSEIRLRILDTKRSSWFRYALSHGSSAFPRDTNRRSQDFLWGCGALFQSSPSKHRLKLINEPLPPSIISSKNSTLAPPGSAWGMHALPGCALTTFPYKFGFQFFYSSWGCKCTGCTPWLRLLRYLITHYLKEIVRSACATVVGVTTATTAV